MPIITLTTDFGIKDGFTGVLKGVIWGICPEAQVADITHNVTPQNVAEGALALYRVVPFFPPGTIHVAVVDPGVGTKRRPMAAQLGDQFFVGPDNGIFTPLIEEVQSKNLVKTLIHLDRPEFWLPNVSHTFHGRDIFAPVGAHLAKDVPLTDLGSIFQDPILLSLAKPVQTSNGWEAQISIIDTFGNLTTNLRAEQVESKKDITVSVKGREISSIVESYGWQKKGNLVALVDSEGYIEIAVVNGSAARELQAEVGDTVQFVYR